MGRRKYYFFRGMIKDYYDIMKVRGGNLRNGKFQGSGRS